MSFTPHRPRMSRAVGVRAGSLIAACGTAGLLVTAATMAQASAAEAPGSMEVTPATGTDASGIAFTTSAACPAEATNIIVSVKGSGFPAEGQNVVGNSPIGTYTPAQTGGISVPLTQTMRDYANTAGFTTLKGRYDFTLTCRTAFNATSLGDFTAPIWFTSNTTYVTNDPAGPNDPPPTSSSASPTNTSAPTDTPSPTDTAPPTDSAEPTDPTDTTTPDAPGATGDPTDGGSIGGSTDGGSIGGSTDGGSTGGGSQDIATDVSGGSSGGGSGSGKGALADTGFNAGTLGAVSAALVLAGVLLVRRARRREDFPTTTDTHDA